MVTVWVYLCSSSQDDWLCDKASSLLTDNIDNMTDHWAIEVPELPG